MNKWVMAIIIVVYTVCTDHPLQYHPDVAVRKEVDKLVIKCALHEKGCTWTGSLKDHEVCYL